MSVEGLSVPPKTALDAEIVALGGDQVDFEDRGERLHRIAVIVGRGDHRCIYLRSKTFPRRVDAVEKSLVGNRATPGLGPPDDGSRRGVADGEGPVLQPGISDVCRELDRVQEAVPFGKMHRIAAELEGSAFMLGKIGVSYVISAFAPTRLFPLSR